MPRSRLHAVGRHCLAALGLVAALAGPVVADSADGLDAALKACAAPGLTLLERVAGLTGAGWMQATPSDAARDRAALFVVAGPLVTGVPSGVLGIGSPSDQFQRARDRQYPEMPAPGAPLDAAALAHDFAGGRFVWSGELDHADVDGTMALVLSRARGVPDAVVTVCLFFLSPTVPATALDALVPEGAAPEMDNLGGGTPGATFRSLGILLDDGAILRLNHTDLTTAPDFVALMAEAGAVAPLSAILSVEMTNVPLR